MLPVSSVDLLPPDPAGPEGPPRRSEDELARIASERDLHGPEDPFTPAETALIAARSSHPPTKESHARDVRLADAVVTAADLVSGDPNADAVDWLWHGYVARGEITLLGAKPKVGKTTLLWSLCMALQDGSPVAGHDTIRARVLLVTEESRGTLRERIARHGAPENLRYVLRRSVPFTTWQELAEGAYELRDTFDVVVFDTYHRLAGFHGDTENQGAAHLARLNALGTILAADKAVVLVAHERKSDSGDIADRARGGNALTGEVDTIISLQPAADPTARVIEARGRHDDTPDRLTIRRHDDGTYTVIEGGLRAERARTRDDEVLDVLPAQAPGMTRAEVGTALGVKDSRTVRARLGALGDQIVITGAGAPTDPYRYHRAPV